MSTLDHLSPFFKAEVKSGGKKLFQLEKVNLTSKSETNIQAFIKTSPPFRVNLIAAAMNSVGFSATCNCPVAKKGRFCKHIWATLLCAEENYPDFLVGKTEISTVEQSSTEPSKADLRKEEQKQKASEYRKEQYQKIKQKKRMHAPPSSTTEMNYPDEVAVALEYFKQNGFEMPDGPDPVQVNEAKKKLSRFFHPDRGGTHEESVELNEHCQVLNLYLKQK